MDLPDWRSVIVLAVVSAGISYLFGTLGLGSSLGGKIVEEFLKKGVEKVILSDRPAADAERGRMRAPAAYPCAEAETHWKSVVEAGTAQAFQDHLDRFPACSFAELARARVNAVTQPASPKVRCVIFNGRWECG